MRIYKSPDEFIWFVESETMPGVYYLVQAYPKNFRLSCSHSLQFTNQFTWASDKLCKHMEAVLSLVLGKEEARDELG